MLICEIAKCTGCSACADVCVQNCIEIKHDDEGFLRSYVNECKCIDCRQCIAVCPVNNPANIHPIQKAYKVRRLNKEAILKSTSGGVAALLSEQFIEKGGTVCGCGFDDTITLKHMFAKTQEQLENFKGSKYVQSQTAGSYRKIKDLLKNGDSVLFIGTPCQVSGLKSFLKKEYANLFAIDLICHGVASQKILDKYIDRCRMQGAVPQNVVFRRKDKGYIKSQDNDLIIEHETGATAIDHKKGIVLWFASGISLRESCYRCSFVSTRRCGDLTLADYVGDDITDEERQHGVSMVFVNTAKGQQMFNQMQEAEKKEVCCEDAQKRYARLRQKSNLPKVRKRFFSDLNRLSLEQMEEVYTLKKICSG